jgi:protoporphyrinogen oxidase
MKVVIIGAGFAGLAAGYYLAKKGVSVTIFEKGAVPGGLATGYRESGWDWTVEKHYHHVFSSDTDIINLAKEVGTKINFSKCITATLTERGIYQLDSPVSLLKFPGLDMFSKVRTGLTLAFLILSPFTKTMEKITAKKFITRFMGESSWKVLWEPLFVGKFGRKADKIPTAWFWARIKKRSARLGYPEGGYEKLAEQTALAIRNLGGNIIYQKEVGATRDLLTQYDKVIDTRPPGKVPYLGAITLILRLNKPFLPEGIYWLNIGLLNFSFLNIVEHTNFIPREKYGQEHLLYVGNYLPHDHRFFSLTKEEILKAYDHDLAKISPDYKKNVIGVEVFKSGFAQPIFPLNYSEIIAPIETDTPGLYQISMEQVYPWDRGVNYAVAIGKRAAGLILRK